MANLGYVGLGAMGSRVVKRLLDAGHTVTGYNRTKSKAQWLLDAGMHWADSPREVAETADIVFTMVTNTQALHEVTSGPNGILAGLGPGKTYIDMSTVSPSKRKPKSEDCKQAIQTVQQQVQEAALAAITMILETFLEAEVTAKLRREKGEPRHVSGQAHEIDWYCRHCGCRDAKRFMRDGHYQRALATNWGVVKALKVPMLECQECGHDVICHYAILEKFQRFWLDLDQDVLLGSDLCESLRHLSQRWSDMVGSSVDLCTINECINQIEPLLKQAHSTPITEVSHSAMGWHLTHHPDRNFNP